MRARITHPQMTKVVVNYCLQIHSCFSGGGVGWGGGAGTACGGLFLGIATVDIPLASNQVRNKPPAPQDTFTRSKDGNTVD